MKLTEHVSLYSATCEVCGNAYTISFSDLHALFVAVPDKAYLERSLLCVCELPSPDLASPSAVTLDTESRTRRSGR